ncbi:MAG: SoxR reducing system RseC family protein [bacterium]
MTTTEEGIVIKIDNATAWVKIIKSASCKGCSAKVFCSSSDNENQMEVETINSIGAQIGDRVTIGLQTASYLKISCLLYLFPILSMIAGAIIGEKVASEYLFHTSALSALFGFLFFLLSLFVVKLVANKIAKKKEYKPKILYVFPK